MDRLIKDYAKKAKELKVGDYTFEGFLAEFAKKVLEEHRDQIQGWR
jgi:hypothetical protein